MAKNHSIRQADLSEYIDKFAYELFEPQYEALIEEMRAIGPKLYQTLVDRKLRAKLEALPAAFKRIHSCVSLYVPSLPDLEAAKHRNRSRAYGNQVLMYYREDGQSVALPVVTDCAWRDASLEDHVQHAKRPDVSLAYVAHVARIKALEKAVIELVDAHGSFVEGALALVKTTRTANALREAWPAIAEDFITQYGSGPSTGLIVRCESLDNVIDTMRMKASLIAMKEAA